MTTEPNSGTTPKDETTIEKVNMDHSDVDETQETRIESQPSVDNGDSMNMLSRVITIVSLYFILVCGVEHSVECEANLGAVLWFNRNDNCYDRHSPYHC